MRNTFLDDRTANDIDRQVMRVLADLGNPEPPLSMELVREMLRIDRAFYSSTDAGVLRETFHRLKVAGHQVLKRPMLLVDVVRKLDLKALWLPDRKRILIDSELPKPKVRWAEAHEVGHSIIPWHDAMLLGDKERTLSVSCHSRLEVEANYAAGRLVFLRDRFTQEVRSSELSFEVVRTLSKAYGNTMTSTLWRFVEACEVPVYGLVTVHPRHVVAPNTLKVRHSLESSAFRSRFGELDASSVFVQLSRRCHGNRGPIGEGHMILQDLRGEENVFYFETFFNGHDALTLARWQGIRRVCVGGGPVARASLV